MIILVTGGSGSGKSAFAEDLLITIGAKNRVYIATMFNYGDKETDERINRHREMRIDKEFDTLECYYDIEKVKLNQNSNILLECMSNLVANEIYINKSDNTQQKIVDAIKNLKTENLVIVTNEIFTDGIDYDDETKNYISILGKINTEIAQIADEVYEIVYGIPILLKRG